MTAPENRTPYTPGPENQSTAQTSIWPQPTSYTLPGPPPLPSPPKKKHTARTVALIVVAAVLAVCGIGGIAAVAGGGGSTGDKTVAVDTTPDPTPAATTEAPVAEPVVTDKPTTKAPTAKPLSREQQNAIQEAKDYLDYQAFSRSGLIRQLESKYGAGFTHAQAVYGVSKAGL